MKQFIHINKITDFPLLESLIEIQTRNNRVAKSDGRVHQSSLVFQGRFSPENDTFI